MWSALTCWPRCPPENRRKRASILAPAAMGSPGEIEHGCNGAAKGHGVTCLEVEVDELMKGAGSVHCMTGVVHREAV